jgi:hypothetical protein
MKNIQHGCFDEKERRTDPWDKPVWDHKTPATWRSKLPLKFYIIRFHRSCLSRILSLSLCLSETFSVSLSPSRTDPSDDHFSTILCKNVFSRHDGTHGDGTHGNKSFENPAWPNFLELRQQMKRQLPPLQILKQWTKEGREEGSWK